jgi:hypothetical protein
VANLNSGKHWSELDLQDLRDGLRLRCPVAELADYLLRDVAEVRTKIAELEAEQNDRTLLLNSTRKAGQGGRAESRSRPGNRA